MRCDDFQDRWQTLLDERRSVQDDNLLAAHAAECSDCSEFLEIQSRLFGEIERSKRSRRKSSLPAKNGVDRRDRIPAGSARHTSVPHFANSASQTSERSQTKISTQSPVAARTGFSRRQITNALAVGLAVAGALLIAFLPALRPSSGGGSGGLSRSIARNSGRAAMPSTIWVGSTPGVSPRNEDADSGRAEIATAVPTPAEQEALRNLMQQMSDNFAHVPEKHLDSIAGGLRPLTDTLNAALDALRRSIPVSRSHSLNEPQAIFSWASSISPV